MSFWGERWCNQKLYQRSTYKRPLALPGPVLAKFHYSPYSPSWEDVLFTCVQVGSKGNIKYVSTELQEPKTTGVLVLGRTAS